MRLLQFSVLYSVSILDKVRAFSVKVAPPSAEKSVLMNEEPIENIYKEVAENDPEWYNEFVRDNTLEEVHEPNHTPLMTDAMGGMNLTSQDVMSFDPQRQNEQRKMDVSEDGNCINLEGPSQSQLRAAKIAESFVLDEDYQPFLTNKDVQTIGGFFLRDTCSFVPKQRTWEYIVSAIRRSKGNIEDHNFWDAREQVETPDGDWFHADIKYSGRVKDKVPTVVILHGLESNSKSPIAVGMAKAFCRQGMNAVCLNFRGCSGRPNRKIGGYHLGFTDDLLQYLKILKERTSDPVYLSGFSLGANAVLKCLGELGEDAETLYNVRGAAVCSAPLDQEKNSPALASQKLYSSRLLQSLQAKAVEQLERHCDNDPNTSTFDFPRGMSAANITVFDDAFIAPIYGFDSAFDYYRKTSSIFYLDQITVPTLIINAKDDPFFDPSVWPIEKPVSNGGKSPIKLVRYDHGGHLGFSFHMVDEDDKRLRDGEPSWSLSELAKFIKHVETCKQ